MKKIFIIKLNRLFLAIISLIILLSCTIYLINFFLNKPFSVKDTYAAIIPDSAIVKVAHPKLAIIIDDFGQSRSGVKEMLSIKRHLTLAVMPFLQFSQSDAVNADSNGHEVIVHLPLESLEVRKSWLGPKPIMMVMGRAEIQQIVLESTNNIPYAKGINIHMGSKAGDDERVLSDILDIVKLKNLYFVDSRASRHPVAKKIANTKSVTCFDRDVFLDGKKPKEYIKNQLDLAADIAIKKGSSIAIGHVGSEGGQVTAQAIIEKIPEFDEKNIDLVYVSELIEK